MNGRLLTQIEFVKKMNLCIEKSIENGKCLNPHEKWESLKIDVIEATKLYAKENASNKHLVIIRLEDKIKLMDEKNQNDTIIYAKTVADLEEIVQEKTRGAIFRSRCKWHEEGEKASSKYFLNLEKNRAGTKTMTNLITEDGSQIIDPKRILNEQKVFYQQLYAKDETVSFDFKNSSEIAVTEEENNELEKDFTYDDLHSAIKSCKRNKSPGCDGIIAEFYAIFCEKIKICLFEAIQYCFKIEHMHDSALKGIITCISKKGRDSRKLHNLRPISLLNVDCKVIEKMIANRIKPILMRLIHEDQKGFLPKRRISANVRCILDIIDHLENEKEEGVIMSVGYQKCFDMIDHHSLIGALRYFKFSEVLVKWTEILYTDTKSCVVNGGNTSDWFPIQRGVKQGAPCSAYFFLICAEVLAIMLRENVNIQGFKINDFKKLFGQYADDMDLYCKPTKQNMYEIKKTLEQFNKGSGCKINYEKSTIYRVGKKTHAIPKKYTQSMKVVEDRINVLGVWVTQEENICEINYGETITKMRAVLNSWKTRNLSLYGKVVIINTLAASLFVYKMYVLPNMSNNMINQLEKLCNEFIWNSRRPKIKISTLQSNINNGGVKLVNFKRKDKALKVSWIAYLQHDTALAALAYNFLCPIMKENIWRCNLNTKDVDAVVTRNGFWKDVLKNWSELNFKETVESEQMLAQIIWFNSHIKINGKVYLNSRACKNDLLYISQLVDPKGNFLSSQEIKIMFNLDIMSYNLIKSAIPKQWIKDVKEICTKNVLPCTEESNYELICTATKPVQFYYLKMEEVNDTIAVLVIKWNLVTGINLVPKHIIKAFENIRKITSNAKLRSMQYRLLHRALVFKRDLFRWKIVIDQKCTLCGTDIENLEHVFWECEIFKLCMKAIFQYLEESLQHDCESLKITKQNVMLNCIDKNPGGVANFLLLICKAHMYVEKCKNKKVTKKSVFIAIEKTKKYELYIAKQNNKMNDFNIKWYGKNTNPKLAEILNIDQILNEMSI